MFSETVNSNDCAFTQTLFSVTETTPQHQNQVIQTKCILYKTDFNRKIPDKKKFPVPDH